MILYFTGTGNSKFAAEYIADHISDECVSLNDIIKYKRPLKFDSSRPFVVAAPIYAWGFPRIVEKLIMKAEFTGSDQIYFIGTMGSQSGDTDKRLEALAQKKGMEFMGFCGIAMPNNYINGGNIPEAGEAAEIILNAMPLMKELSGMMIVGEHISKRDKTPLSSLVSGTVNSMFNEYFMSSDNFVISDQCISCGQCVKVCPVNNITLNPGAKPEFDRYCLNCYSCIHRCPLRAIDIGKHTRKYPRYVCPDYDDWKEIGLID